MKIGLRLSVQELLGIWPKEICEKIGDCPEPQNFSYLLDKKIDRQKRVN